MDMRNFKTSSSKGSTYSDFSALSAYSAKSRDYYFMSPSYRSAGAPTPSNHSDLYTRERPRHLRNPNPSPPCPCPCSRSRSLEDVRTDIVTEWEDDDENGNRIVAPATKFNRTTYKNNNPPIQKQNFLTRHSMENLADRPQLLPPKRISAFQVIELTFYNRVDSLCDDNVENDNVVFVVLWDIYIGTRKRLSDISNLNTLSRLLNEIIAKRSE